MTDISIEPEKNAAVASAPVTADRMRSLAVFLFAATSAFGTYFCMYGVREPFKVAEFNDITPLFGIFRFKLALVITQVLGYTISKFIGIQSVAEMNPNRRAGVLIALVCAAELALVGFGLIPPPWNAAMLFLNGLCLGTVFGLVMGFLEGRRQSEAMLAGLCSSFVAAPGVTKGVGKWLMTRGFSPFWMPSMTGLIFLLPLVGFVWALRHIPKPDANDVLARCERAAIDSPQRWALFCKYAPGLILIMTGYLLLTILRSIRNDFAAEIWKAMGVDARGGTFAASETIVAIVTLLLFAGLVFIRSNKTAFFSGIVMSIIGFATGTVALLGFNAGLIHPFPFIVMLGIGMYLPYMAVHTTLFERLLAVTRDKGNIGYLMYLVDAFGYLGYVAVLLGEGFIQHATVMPLFKTAAWFTMLGGMGVFGLAAIYFARHSAVRKTVGKTSSG